MTNQEQIIFPERPVLIVDDEQEALNGAALVLESDGIFNVILCQDSRKIASLMTQTRFGAVLLDLSMPHQSGEVILPTIREQHPDVPVIILTGHNDLDTAITCMKTGAFDYLVKPVHAARLTSAVRRAIELNDLKNEYQSFKHRVLSNKLDHPDVFERIITRSPKMLSMFQYIETVATTPRPVLITGETGVGKELVATAIHESSGRKGPFVPINVAGLDDNVFSDTLFGHLRSAFTGADAARKGLVHKAAGGTLFLDEIGDLEMSSQVKLLRLLQENEYYPLGADGAIMSDARIVVATNRSIADLKSAGDFRQDLYFRLQTHHVRIPPLKERPDDIPILTEYFIKKSSKILNKNPPSFTRELTHLLLRYQFPGNVRELEGMIFEAVSRHKRGPLSLKTFKEKMDEASLQDTDTALLIPVKNTSSPLGSTPVTFGEELPTLNEVQRLLIQEALRRTAGNQTTAADMLGITRSGLSKAIKRKGLII